MTKRIMKKRKGKEEKTFLECTEIIWDEEMTDISPESERKLYENTHLSAKATTGES